MAKIRNLSRSLFNNSRDAVSSGARNARGGLGVSSSMGGIKDASRFKVNRNNTGGGTARPPKEGLERMGFSRDAAKEIGNLGTAAKSFGQNINNSGGWKGLAGAAGRGAIGGGLIGAGASAVQGQDVWEGAKQGATMGAAGYGGVTALKRGVGASSYKGIADGASQFNRQAGVSKSVQRLAEMGKDSAQASKLFNRQQG